MWTKAVRQQTDDRFEQDLLVLCNNKQPGQSEASASTMGIGVQRMQRRAGKLIPSGPLVCLAAVGVVVSAVACSGSREASPRQYSDEELGLNEIVDHQIVGNVLPHARYRTLEEMDLDLTDPTEGSGHERERNYFVHNIRLMIALSSESLPPDVADESGVLYDAMEAALADCVAESSWPGVVLYDTAVRDVYAHLRQFGLTWEEFLDLRHECSKYAVTYPTLDPAYRDELLAKRRAHYMAVVREWMALNPDAVVPVEYHEGANTPVEDYWRKACKVTDDYDQCLRDALVEP